MDQHGLKKARRQRQHLEAMLVKAVRAEQEALLEGRLQTDPEMCRLTSREQELRSQLHRIRLSLPKRAASIQCQERKLAKTRTVLAELQEREAADNQELEEVLKSMETRRTAMLSSDTPQGERREVA